MITNSLKTKIGKPILKLLKQGTTPEKMSLSIATGAIVGIMPVLGATTLLSAIIAIRLRLNIPVVQLINYLVYPLQFLLIIPYVKLGALIFQVEPILFSVQELSSRFQHNFWTTVLAFSETIGFAIVAWLLSSIPIFILVYAVSVSLLRHVHPLTSADSCNETLSTDCA